MKLRVHFVFITYAYAHACNCRREREKGREKEKEKQRERKGEIDHLSMWLKLEAVYVPEQRSRIMNKASHGKRREGCYNGSIIFIRLFDFSFRHRRSCNSRRTKSTDSEQVYLSKRSGPYTKRKIIIVFGNKYTEANATHERKNRV